MGATYLLDTHRLPLAALSGRAIIELATSRVKVFIAQTRVLRGVARGVSRGTT